MLRNSVAGYGWVSIATHWITAIAVVGLFLLGLWMVDLDYYSSWYQTAPDIHKSIGVLLALLIVLRIGWKLLNTNPRPLGTPLMQKSALAAHGIIYLLLFAIFISGYLLTTAEGQGIDVFGWFQVPAWGPFIEEQDELAGEIHELFANILMWLVGLHGAAALYHHFFHKDNTLIRMLKPTLEEDKK